MNRISVAALLCLLVAPALSAQEDQVFTGFVAVDLVLVDVVVEDRLGNPVLDLTREDFRLYQDGEPVEITHFTGAQGDGVPSTTPSAAATEAPATAATPPRRLILFIDNLHLRPSSRKRVFDKLSRALDRYLQPRDEVMIVTYGGTTRVALEMTHNRRALRNALRDEAEGGAVSLLALNDDQRVLDLMQQMRFLQANGAPQGNSTACLDVDHLAHSHAQQVYTRVRGSISELNRFVNSLAGYEGPKALLHVSDGIPLVAGNEAYRYASELCDGTGLNKGIPNATDTTWNNTLKNRYWDPTKTANTLREFDTTGEWTRLASHANTYQVSFYMFQARPPSGRSTSITDTRTSIDVEREAARNRQDALFMLADETGGVAMLDANDVEPALARMSEDARSGYQLAFEPSAPGDGRQHRIRVEVTRPGLEVRHRKSFRSKPTDERVEDRVISALLHGLSDNPLDVRLEVDDVKRVDRDVSQVKVSVHVPLDEIVLLPEDQVQRGLFSVFLVVRDGFDQVSPVGRKTVPVRVPLEPTEDEFVYTVEVPVRGERGSIAVAVQDNLGAEVTYLERELRLPASSS